jgi:putative DNA primase/helicase
MSLEALHAPLSPNELAQNLRPQPVDDVQIITPVPHTAETFEQAATRLGKHAPDGCWTYRNSAGQPLFAVARWNRTDGSKDIKPISFVRHVDGREGFAFKHHPAPRPLYGLERLAANLNAGIVIVEGERCADAAATVFPQSVCMTWTGGANAIGKVDWSPLAGRRVLIWPDHDAPGHKAATDIARKLHDIGLDDIRIVDPSKIKDAKVCDGWDCADALADGWDVIALRKAVAIAADPYHAGPAFVSFGGFTMNDNGLTIEIERGKGDSATTEDIWLSDAFEIVGRARDPHSTGWARWLRWKDSDGKVHDHPVSDAALHGDGAALAAVLADMGLKISNRPALRAHWMSYLNQAEINARVTVVHRTGWHHIGEHRAFVLPAVSIAESRAGKVILTGGNAASYSHSGTLQQWRESVGTLTAGHARPVLAVSTAFAGVLLDLIGSEGGGLNLYGESSRGKSTCLEAAASVWGKGAIPGYVRSWRSTANALEASAALATDTLLALDELGVVDPKDAGAGAYQLAGGSGKGRSARDGSMRAPQTWRVMVLSTGELPMSAKIAEGKGRAKAGQQIRLLDIPADGGKGFGAFDHGGPESDAGKLSNAIKQAARTHYGTAGPAFVRKLIDDGYGEVASAVREAMRAFSSKHLSQGADGQVSRAADRLALIGVAGELATDWGLTGWQPGEAASAAGLALSSWINERGGTDAGEIRDAISTVRLFIEQYGDARFELMDDNQGRAIPNRAGYRRGEGEQRQWLIPPEVWKSEICAGLDAKFVAKTLSMRGMIERASDGYQCVIKIGGVPRRLYVLTSAIFESDRP